MNSLAHDLALYLSAAPHSLATFPPVAEAEWGIGAGVELDQPLQFITITDTGGVGPDTDEQDLEQPTFQVRVRAQTWPVAYEKYRAIRTVLLAAGSSSLQTSDVVGFAATSDVIDLGRDDSDRRVLVANYRAIRTEKE